MTKRTRSEIEREIEYVMNQLEPENLSCDGERTGDEYYREQKRLNAKLTSLENELQRGLALEDR